MHGQGVSSSTGKEHTGGKEGRQKKKEVGNFSVAAESVQKKKYVRERESCKYAYCVNFLCKYLRIKV